MWPQKSEQNMDEKVIELEKHQSRRQVIKHAIAAAGSLLAAGSLVQAQQTTKAPSSSAPVQSPERKTTMSQKGRILGIGGIFFKSANKQQMQEWYGKHLGLVDGGHGVMLPWREKDNPD